VSSPPGRRRRFVDDRARFAFSLRSLLERVGFVESRGRRSVSALARRARKRSRARSRLRSCDRSSATTTRSESPKLSSRRARCHALSEELVEMEKTHSTRVLEVFACCPPGPPLPLNLHSSSSSGILSLRLTTRTRVGPESSSGVSGTPTARPRSPSRAATPLRFAPAPLRRRRVARGVVE
jgi:hypothetical protein